jgi:hypothetical protein
MSEPFDDENAIKGSKYNSAIAKEIRRNLLWTDANNHSRTGQYAKWNEDLDCVWSELCVDLIKRGEDFLDEDLKNKETDYKKYKDKFEEINNAIERIGNFNDNLNKGFLEPTTEQIKKRNEHYKKLRGKEIFLRALENNLGKGTKEEEEDDDW